MKRAYLILLLLIPIFLLSCNSNTDNNTNSNNNTNNKSYPSLKIVSNYSGYISRVGLTGYSFDDLRIEQNESKTFELKNGIDGGLENVNVNLSFRPDSIHIDPRNPASIKCNFTNGKTTTITLPETGNLIVSYE